MIYISELILILVSAYNYSDLPKDIYLYYGDYIYLEVPVGATEILRSVYGYCRTYPYTKISVGITEFILIRSLYNGTCRYYRTYTYTKVPVGTT